MLLFLVGLQRTGKFTYPETQNLRQQSSNKNKKHPQTENSSNPSFDHKLTTEVEKHNTKQVHEKKKTHKQERETEAIE